MFINLSNHPSALWSDSQLREAMQFGDIIDINFPRIPASENEEFIHKLVMKYASKLKSEYNPETDIFHIMGEMCFSFSLIKELSSLGFTCVASTTERIVNETKIGYKEVSFNFVKFRKYCL